MSQPSDHEPESGLRLSALVDGEVSAAHVAGLCVSWKEEEAARRTWHTYQLIGDTLRSDDLATDPARDCDFLARLRARLADEPVVLAPLAAAYYESGVQATVDAPVEQTRPAADGSPTRRTAARSSARRWRMPMTVAASVLAVTGVLMVARVSGLLPSDGAQPGQFAQGGTSQQAVAPGVQQTAPQSFAAASPALDAGSKSGLQTVSTQALSVDPQGTSLSAVQPQTLIASGKLIRDARLDQYLAAHKQFGGSTALGVPSGFLRSATSESRDR